MKQWNLVLGVANAPLDLLDMLPLMGPAQLCSEVPQDRVPCVQIAVAALDTGLKSKGPKLAGHRPNSVGREQLENGYAERTTTRRPFLCMRTSRPTPRLCPLTCARASRARRPRRSSRGVGLRHDANGYPRKRLV